MWFSVKVGSSWTLGQTGLLHTTGQIGQAKAPVLRAQTYVRRPTSHSIHPRHFISHGNEWLARLHCANKDTILVFFAIKKTI